MCLPPCHRVCACLRRRHRVCQDSIAIYNLYIYIYIYIYLYIYLCITLRVVMCARASSYVCVCVCISVCVYVRVIVTLSQYSIVMCMWRRLCLYPCIRRRISLCRAVGIRERFCVYAYLSLFACVSDLLLVCVITLSLDQCSCLSFCG